MPTRPDAAALVALLPGTWRLGATNSPMWLAGDRLLPTFRYDLKSTDPLVFDDVVSYTNPDGAEKSIIGVDRYRHDEFVGRSRRLLSLRTSRWSVVGVSGDANVLVRRFHKSLFAPAGVDVVVREGTESQEFRAVVAVASESLGLTDGEFASLSWLALAD